MLLLCVPDLLHDATMKQQLIVVIPLISECSKVSFESKFQIEKPGEDHELNSKSWLTKEDEGCSCQPS